MSVPLLQLNSGDKIPAVGLGTWKSKAGEVEKAIGIAIDCGYRHIDGAWVYGNENEVGNAVAAKVKENVVKREDLFITSKLWNSFHKPKDVREALKDTLDKLQTNYVDLYLIHWPQCYVRDGFEKFPKDKDGKILHDDTDYIDTWKALEEVKKEGLARNIGLSNFTQSQIDRILQNCTVPPAVNQVELHPYLTQTDLIEYCKNKGIVVTAYSPLGSPDRPWAKPDDPQLLENPKLKEIAGRLKKSVAQVLLKFQLQRGLSVIPKSVTPSRIKENFQLFDFQLSDEDMKIINGFNRNHRFVFMNSDLVHKNYPFKEDSSK